MNLVLGLYQSVSVATGEFGVALALQIHAAIDFVFLSG